VPVRLGGTGGSVPQTVSAGLKSPPRTCLRPTEFWGGCRWGRGGIGGGRNFGQRAILFDIGKRALNLRDSSREIRETIFKPSAPRLPPHRPSVTFSKDVRVRHDKQVRVRDVFSENNCELAKSRAAVYRWLPNTVHSVYERNAGAVFVRAYISDISTARVVSGVQTVLEIVIHYRAAETGSITVSVLVRNGSESVCAVRHFSCPFRVPNSNGEWLTPSSEKLAPLIKKSFN